MRFLLPLLPLLLAACGQMGPLVHPGQQKPATRPLVSPSGTPKTATPMPAPTVQPPAVPNPPDEEDAPASKPAQPAATTPASQP